MLEVHLHKSLLVMNMHLKVFSTYFLSYFCFDLFSALLDLVYLPPFFEVFVCVYTLDNIFFCNYINFHSEFHFPQRCSSYHLYEFLTHLWRSEGNKKSMKISSSKLTKRTWNKQWLWEWYLIFSLWGNLCIDQISSLDIINYVHNRKNAF